MKKLIAFICAVAMMLTLAIPALANPSIEEVVTQVEEVVLGTELSEESEGFEVVVAAVNPADYNDGDVAEVVSKVNGADESLTVEQVAEALKDKNEGKVVLTTDKGNPVDPSEYSFVTKFSEIALSDGTEAKFVDNGKAVSAKVTLQFSQLAGMQDVSELDNYLIMLIDPESGKIHYIELDKDSFDPETGKVTAEFPCMGAFALIQK